MSTPNFATGNVTISEAMERLEADGFTGQLGVREGGRIICYTCHEESAACDVRLSALVRGEGASDPDDMVAVAALTCPNCGAKGTVALKFGPSASAEEDEVLTMLEDLRDRSGEAGSS